ncbi:MAG: peptide chain release factor N(5)-glutamine methyltransferase [Treponema sp.]|jgi:release factor glutamine methyltransferase|nr:peptide chain release factor N(5)-glutamine methyltransferase [Treponema sp.]
MTIREALTEGTASLTTAGIETPGLDSSLLLAEVLNTSRSSLIAAGNDNISDASAATFRQLIKRRQSGECTAYILGRKEFYGLEFTVNPSVLVPRPDTETLVELIGTRDWGLGTRGQPPRVLDLCTGSGAIAIALKHTMPELEVWATDISAEALETAQKNASHLLPPNSIRFFQGDLYDALLPRPPTPDPRPPTPSSLCYLLPATCYLIVSNPPYVPSADLPSLPLEVRMEPSLALDGGDDGLDVIRKIVARASEFLCPGGALLLEADPRQMAAITDLYKEAGFSDIQTHADLSGRERVISGTSNK